MPDSLLTYLPYLLLVILTAIPAHVLLGKLGLSRWWNLFSVLPIGAVVVLWVVSLRAGRSHVR
jgi:hypothetical protein